MYYKTLLDSKELYNDFSTYDSIINNLFDKEAMICNASNFSKYIEVLHCSGISKPTFYRNIKRINSAYSLYLKPSYIYDTQSLMSVEYIFYWRLTNYLHNYICNKSSNNINNLNQPYLKQIYVTKNFYPLYVALIYSILKIDNWSCMHDAIICEFKKILECSDTPELRIVSLPVKTVTNYYKYWLELFIPTELCEIVHTAEKVLENEKIAIRNRYLRYNLGLFIEAVAKSYFKSTHIQKLFLTDASNILNSFNSKLEIDPMSGDRLNYYKYIEDTEYSKYLKNKQESGKP